MSKHSGLASDRNVTVFEAANDELKEVYVTWTSRPIFQAMADLDTHPPAAIAHWRPAQQHVAFRSLEFGLTCESARLFIARRVEKRLSEGWKYVVEPQSKDKPRRGPVSS